MKRPNKNIYRRCRRHTDYTVAILVSKSRSYVVRTSYQGRPCQPQSVSLWLRYVHSQGDSPSQKHQALVRSGVGPSERLKLAGDTLNCSPRQLHNRHRTDTLLSALIETCLRSCQVEVKHRRWRGCGLSGTLRIGILTPKVIHLLRSSSLFFFDCPLLSCCALLLLLRSSSLFARVRIKVVL